MNYGGSVSAVNFLADDLYVVYTSAEGQVAVRVVRWTEKNGAKDTDFPELWLGMAAHVAFYYEPKTTSLYLLSAVPLRGKEAEVDHHKDYTQEDTHLYRWVKNKGFENLALRLQGHVALQSVASKRTAWLTLNKNRICTGQWDQVQACSDILPSLKGGDRWSLNRDKVNLETE